METLQKFTLSKYKKSSKVVALRIMFLERRGFCWDEDTVFRLKDGWLSMLSMT